MVEVLVVILIIVPLLLLHLAALTLLGHLVRELLRADQRVGGIGMICLAGAVSYAMWVVLYFTASFVVALSDMPTGGLIAINIILIAYAFLQPVALIIAVWTNRYPEGRIERWRRKILTNPFRRKENKNVDIRT